mgnify:CR=1 FL=1
MSEKKVGKRLLTWVLVLVMTLSLLPLNVLAAHPVGPAKVIRPDVDKYLTYEFYVDGALYGKQQIVKNGDTLLAPETPKAATGQRFIGWYKGTEKFEGFGTTQGPITASETIRLDAKFEEVYYVYFHAPGENGNIVKTKEGMTGDKIPVDDVTFAHEPNESITGWYTDAAYTSDKVKFVTLGTKNVDLYAKVEQGHWITFDSNNGSYVAPQFVTDKTTEPTAPTRAGYTFAGWLLNGAAFTFGSALDADITLTAEWAAQNEVSYTVIHWQENANDNDYSYVESAKMTGVAGEQTKATAKSYEGFTAQTIAQQAIAGDGSTIVNVKYKRNEYQVRFFSKNGRTEYTELTITAKYGAFIGDQWPGGIWKTSPGGTTFQANIQTMPLKGFKFYKTGQGSAEARYYLQGLDGKYRWDHTDKGGSWGSTVTKEDRYSITGYTLNKSKSTEIGGWYNGAEFYYDRNSYNVVYMNNGEKVNEKSYKFEASIADAGSYTPTRPEGIDAAYVFDGWYADPDGAQPFVFTGKTMPAQNIIVYAKWAAPVHKVTFMSNGEQYNMIKDVAHKATVILPENPTPPAGEEFLGWVDENGKPFKEDTQITRNLILTARFGSRTGYKVTYDTTGGNSTPVNDSNRYGKDAAATVLDGASTALPNMVFLYWKDGAGTKYYPNSTITINGDVKLTAVYDKTPQPVSITYHSNFGTPGTSGTTVTVNNIPNNDLITVMTYEETKLPTRKGYTFAGWNTQAKGTGTAFGAGTDARIDNDGENHLYAQWTPATDTKYTVEHYQQNLENSEYTLAATDNLTGTTGTTTNAKAKTYPGFTAQAFVQQPIAPDGSTIIKIYYDRIEYKVTYQYDGAAPEGASELPTEAKYKFGAEVTVAAPATATGYNFSGWTTEDATIKEGKFEMPAKGVKLTGSFVKDDTQWYTVKYTWTGVPEGAEPPVTFPTDSNTYLGEAAAKNAVDKKYTSSSKVTGSDGFFYTFSGWDEGTVKDQVVTFNGS